MAAFGPKGETAEWKMIYEALCDMSVGDILRYDALDELLGRSFSDEGAKRNPLQRACREFEEVNHRTLATVRGIGYRVVAASEHVDLARNHQKRSRRQMVRAKERLDSTELRELTDLERRRHDEMMLSNERILSYAKRIERRQVRIERLLRGDPKDI